MKYRKKRKSYKILLPKFLKVGDIVLFKNEDHEIIDISCHEMKDGFPSPYISKLKKIEGNGDIVEVIMSPECAYQKLM